MTYGKECTAMRYEYVVDPSDVYVIWDNVLDLPATADREMLTFSTEGEALVVTEQLNRRHWPGLARRTADRLPVGRRR